jgi:hypothetical protein
VIFGALAERGDHASSGAVDRRAAVAVLKCLLSQHDLAERSAQHLNDLSAADAVGVYPLLVADPENSASMCRQVSAPSSSLRVPPRPKRA